LDWSREEVEAIVADYIAMLIAELRSEAYNKTEHRRNLKRLLQERTDAAIERKHGNISAILIQLGFPYISGYKPYGNYQGLLREVVAGRLRVPITASFSSWRRISRSRLFSRRSTTFLQPGYRPRVDPAPTERGSGRRGRTTLASYPP
jgi:hypothetical protein